MIHEQVLKQYLELIGRWATIDSADAREDLRKLLDFAITPEVEDGGK